MKKSKICERERIQLEKMNKFQLGIHYKKVGFMIAIGSFVLMIAIKYIDNPEWLKPFFTWNLINWIVIDLCIKREN